MRAVDGDLSAQATVRERCELLDWQAVWPRVMAARPEAGPILRDLRSGTMPVIENGAGPDTGIELRTLAEILADPEALKPPRVVVPRIAWEGRVTLLAAREKAGKSTLAGIAASRKSAGGDFLGEHMDQGVVLWVGLEEHVHDIARRFSEAGADPAWVFVLERLNDPLADIATAIDQCRPSLVVIDTLPALADLLSDAPDAGSSTAWTPIMQALARPAREHDAALVLLHHSRKSDGAYRDSTAIGAGVDVILEMQEGTDSNVRKVKAKARWALDDYSIRLVGSSYELEGGTLNIETRVLLFVEKNPGCSQRKVREGVEGSAEVIASAIRKLIGSGTIRDNGTGSSGMRLEVVLDPLDAERLVAHLGGALSEPAK